MQQDLELLRAWYLARLRRLALDDKLRLSATPNTLVGADRHVINSLLLKSIQTQANFNYKPSKALLIYGIAFGLALLAAVLVVVVC